MRENHHVDTCEPHSDTENDLRVRKPVFTHVYYNNGNSLPFFSIPSIRGKYDQTRSAALRCASQVASFGPDAAISTVFFGVTCAPPLLEAGLLFSKDAGAFKEPSRYTYSWSTSPNPVTGSGEAAIQFVAQVEG